LGDLEGWKEEHSLVVYGWWVRDRWHPQRLIGFPIPHLMNHDLGPVVGMGGGFASRYLREGEDEELNRMNLLFENVEFNRFLERCEWNGIVTFILGLSDRKGWELMSAQMGSTSYALLTLLEGSPVKIGEFLQNPLSYQLRESWVGALLVSQFPFPFVEEKEEWTEIRGLTPEVHQHFWAPFLTHRKKGMWTKSTIVGIATAWSGKVGDVGRRLKRTCENVYFKDKQYRTDLVGSVQKRWFEVRNPSSYPHKEPY
jgi:hypothetical protein